MKSVMLLLIAVAVLAGLSGCAGHGMVNGACAGGPAGCTGAMAGGQCGPAGCGAGFCGPGACGHEGLNTVGMKGATPVSPPPFGAVTYPYYTVRGPRDFLNPGPRPLGP